MGNVQGAIAAQFWLDCEAEQAGFSYSRGTETDLNSIPGHQQSSLSSLSPHKGIESLQDSAFAHTCIAQALGRKHRRYSIQFATYQVVLRLALFLKAVTA